MFNFSEISELFLSREAAVQVDSGEALARQITQWLKDASERSRFGEAGRELVDMNRGALDRLTRIVEQLLDNQ
jgi:3-deoxy-D-manno-octulosonic-acid transferase